jgi:hypothetical protein
MLIDECNLADAVVKLFEQPIDGQPLLLIIVYVAMTSL